MNISAKQFLEKLQCCGERMFIIENVDSMDMTINSLDIAICTTCGSIVEVRDYIPDMEDIETIIDNYKVPMKKKYYVDNGICRVCKQSIKDVNDSSRDCCDKCLF